MIIDALNKETKELNEIINSSNELEFNIKNALGQRYIGAGSSNLSIKIEGIPGNALGAYLDGSKIEVFGNSSDSLGDTMNDGTIIIHGNGGDTVGYAMRGGKIYVRGNVGYRCGIHMKAYMDKFPIIIVGGSAGSFLGEYQAGGIIVVLGLDDNKYFENRLMGNFTSTGMYGGKLFVRSDCKNEDFPKSVDVLDAKESDLDEIKEYLEEYCSIFNLDLNKILNHKFKVIIPNKDKPKTNYVTN